MKAPATTLISTVGTSLIRSQLGHLRADDPDTHKAGLAHAREAGDWHRLAAKLGALEPSDQLCGAEINSIASLMRCGILARDPNLVFCCSDTRDGEATGEVLRAYYGGAEGGRVEVIRIEGLQDEDPRRFRTTGLRNLAKAVCKTIRGFGAGHCAINATGGYKAQIAIAVLMGQAIGVPVYYKHERFDEIIAFPPMPVSLDFQFWMRHSGPLFELARSLEPVPASVFAEEWDERCESLVERVTINRAEYLDLSPTGQIFHETFRERFRAAGAAILPEAVPPAEKRSTRVEKAGWPGEHPEIAHFFDKVRDQVPQVVYCQTSYFNPDLPDRTHFRPRGSEIEGVYSNGTFSARAIVHTRAKTEAQRDAMLAALNEWLASS